MNMSIDSNWMYLYQPSKEWGKFCKISIFLLNTQAYMKTLLDTRIPAAVCIPYGGRPAVAAEQLQTHLAQSDGGFLLRRGTRGAQGNQAQE